MIKNDSPQEGSQQLIQAAAARIQEQYATDPDLHTAAVAGCPLKANECALVFSREYITAKLKRAGSSSNPPELGSTLFLNGKRYRLSVNATAKLRELMKGGKPWFPGNETVKDTDSDSPFRLVTAACSFPLLLEKWASSLQASVQFHQTDGGGRPKVEIGSSYAEHEITHFGELAHSLRHLVRGGHITWLDPQSEEAAGNLRGKNLEEDAMKAFVKAQKTDQMSAKDIRALEAELRKKYQPDVDQAKEKLQLIHDKLQFADCLAVLGGAAQVHSPEKRNELDRSQKYNHTDLHLAQVPDDPREFAEQVRCERALPAKIEKTAGYDVIELEVEVLLKQQKCAGKCELIVWHRNVGPFENRRVSPEEHRGCTTGAAQALGQLGQAKILDLGDSGAPCFGGPTLLGTHVTDSKGNPRTLLQQIQFLHAVVKVSKAKLIVSERAGLSDLVALVGGIPMCQFVSHEAHEGNARLPEVHMCGAGMGYVVKPWKEPRGNTDATVVSNAVRAGCQSSLAHNAQLTSELASLPPLPARATVSAAAATAVSSLAAAAASSGDGSGSQ